MSGRSIKMRIGVSSCLLGHKVRYDGKHKKDSFITDVLAPSITIVDVCPEIEIGMGVPREPVRITDVGSGQRLVGTKSGDDWTLRMCKYVCKRVSQEDIKILSGFVFRSKSPSCGVNHVKVYGNKGDRPKFGSGLFAAEFVKTYPDLPVEEDSRLCDKEVRDNFLARVFAYHRWQRLSASPISRERMIEFHNNHKYLLLAHSPTILRRLDNLVDGITEKSPTSSRIRYRHLFMDALRFHATIKKNVKVLRRIVSSIKKQLTSNEIEDVRTSIGDYDDKVVPLVVPIVRLRSLATKYKIQSLTDQVYLNPHPKELLMRDCV